MSHSNQKKHEETFRIGRNGVIDTRISSFCSAPAHLEAIEEFVVRKNNVNDGLAGFIDAWCALDCLDRDFDWDGIGEEKGGSEVKIERTVKTFLDGELRSNYSKGSFAQLVSLVKLVE